jgi:hypothetical protein
MKALQKLGAVLLRALIWALSGALFGGLFTGLYQVFSMYGNPEWMTLLLACGLSGAVTAAFFGAMPVALLGSMVGVLVAIGYQMIGVDNVRPLFMLGVALGIGVLAGSFYSGQMALRLRPLGQTVSGMLAGAIAGPLVFALSGVLAPVAEPMWRAAAAVAFVGIAYVIFSRWILSMCSEWVSARMSGPVVAGLVSLAVAASMWLLGSDITGTAFPPGPSGGAYPAELIALGLLGGAIGGAVGGAALELLGVERAAYQL